LLTAKAAKTANAMAELARVKAELGDLIAAEEEAGKSWYKLDDGDIPVVSETESRRVRPLSEFSPMIKSIKATRQVLLYAKPEQAGEARGKVRRLMEAKV
jgi:hypothetical protein